MKPTPKHPAKPKTAAPGASRRWLFRAIALAVPFLLIAGVEGALRLAGWGFPTGFFLKQDDHYIENQRFGFRFFPPKLARAPEPTRLAAAKPPGAFRVFILGESAALGDPEPAYGFGRILEVLLEDRMPSVDVEIVNAAMTAINSHVIVPIAKDVAKHDGDLWIVYMGNNEVVGPFGAGTAFGSQSPPLGMVRLNLALQRLRIGQAAVQLIRSLRQSDSSETNWKGMEMFLNQQVALDDERLNRVYDSFQQNLEAILNIAQANNVPVLLSTVGVNLKDCPPFASSHRPGLTEPERASWTSAFERGSALETQGQPEEALAAYREALAIDDAYAELHFRMASCLNQTGQSEKALEAFRRARDRDTLRFRTDSRLNEIIHSAAVERKDSRLRFVDAVSLLARESDGGVAGERFFHEHVHFNFEGNYRLALAFAENILPLMSETSDAPADEPAEWLSKERCADQLAFTGWHQSQVWAEVYRRLQEPPFTSQSNHAERDERLDRALTEWSAGWNSSEREEARRVVQSALNRRAEDPVLRRQAARFYEATGDIEAGLMNWRKRLETLPHDEDAMVRLADLLDQTGQSAEAESWFRKALNRRTHFASAWNSLGLALEHQGKIPEAVECFHRALSINPQLAEAHVNLGLLFKNQGDPAKAVEQYAKALELDPDYAPAHINLGQIHSSQDNLQEALRHYEAALKSDPRNPIAHFNLANTLARLERGAEAFAHYEKCLELRPRFFQARMLYGRELGRAGKPSEAAEQFGQAALLEPDNAEAHFNQGVALSQQRRYSEAASAFEKALQLDPANEKARAYLQKAKAMAE